MEQTLMPQPNDSMGKFDKSLSLLSWAYNEEELIVDFLNRAVKLLDNAVKDYEIVLIDDGSTDKTYRLAAEFQKDHPQLKIFRNDKNMNVGYSSVRAVQEATKEYLFWQTVDWSYDISNLRKFLLYLGKYDIVQGVRRSPVRVRLNFLKPFAAALKLFGIKHLTKRSDTVSKAIISVINYAVIRLLFGIPLSDFQNVTFYPTKWIQSVKHESDSSFSSPESLIKAHWNGLSIKEVPIDFIPRQLGEAKGTKIKSITNSVADIARLWFKWMVLGRRQFIKKGTIERLNPKEWGL